MKTVNVHNLQPFDVEIPLPDGTSLYVEAGATVEVPAEVANGTRPSGPKGEDGEFDVGHPDYTPGTGGLLEQTDNWAAVKGSRTTQDTTTSDPEV